MPLPAYALAHAYYHALSPALIFQEAVKLLDTKKRGSITFDEFVSWWVYLPFKGFYLCSSYESC